MLNEEGLVITFREDLKKTALGAYSDCHLTVATWDDLKEISPLRILRRRDYKFIILECGSDEDVVQFNALVAMECPVLQHFAGLLAYFRPAGLEDSASCHWIIGRKGIICTAEKSSRDLFAKIYDQITYGSKFSLRQVIFTVARYDQCSRDENANFTSSINFGGAHDEAIPIYVRNLLSIDLLYTQPLEEFRLPAGTRTKVPRRFEQRYRLVAGGPRLPLSSWDPVAKEYVISPPEEPKTLPVPLPCEPTQVPQATQAEKTVDPPKPALTKYQAFNAHNASLIIEWSSGSFTPLVHNETTIYMREDTPVRCYIAGFPRDSALDFTDRGGGSWINQYAIVNRW